MDGYEHTRTRARSHTYTRTHTHTHTHTDTRTRTHICTQTHSYLDSLKAWNEAFGYDAMDCQIYGPAKTSGIFVTWPGPNVSSACFVWNDMHIISISIYICVQTVDE